MSTLQVSTAQITTLSDGSNSTSSTNAILGSAKAWVNFNGTTSPGTIRASFNVSSVTKNGTGDYTVNFTNALVDANYVVCATTLQSGNSGAPAYGVAAEIASASNTYSLKTSSAVRVSSGDNNQDLFIESFSYNLAIFR
jgi:hypothetical protein